MTAREGEEEAISTSKVANLIPGDSIAVWYSDDTVFHERLLIWRTSPTCWYILTPDGDAYEEEYDCRDPETGPSRVMVKGVDFQYMSRLRPGVYRFREMPGREELIDHIKGFFRMKGLAHVGPEDWRPANIRFGQKVESASAVLGWLIVPRRLPARGHVTTPGLADEIGSGLDPDLVRQMTRLRAAPEGYVWLSLGASRAEDSGGEVQVAGLLGAMCGEETAIICKGGAWDMLKLVKVGDAPSWAEKRRSPIVPEVPEKVDEQDTKEEAEKQDEASGGDDARTIEVDYDEQGERFKEWRKVMTEVREYSFADWPLEGPMTVLHLVKHFGRHGGDPKRWLGEWMRSRHIAETDRVSFEMRCLVDIVYLAGCYDQLNLPVLASVETACRRIQAIVEAYSAGSAGTPDWGAARIITAYKTPDDAISPQLRTWAARRGKEEVELHQAREKIRPTQAEAQERGEERLGGPSSAMTSLVGGSYGPGAPLQPREGRAARSAPSRGARDIYPLPKPLNPEKSFPLSRRSSQRFARKFQIQTKVVQAVEALNWMARQRREFSADSFHPDDLQQQVLSRIEGLSTRASDLGTLDSIPSPEAALRELLRGRSDYGLDQPTALATCCLERP